MKVTIQDIEKDIKLKKNNLIFTGKVHKHVSAQLIYVPKYMVKYLNYMYIKIWFS